VVITTDGKKRNFIAAIRDSYGAVALSDGLFSNGILFVTDRIDIYFMAGGTFIEKNSRRIIESSIPITLYYVYCKEIIYHAPQSTYININMARKPTQVTINESIAEYTEWDDINSAIELLLPAGEGKITFGFE
jgi:hypothetical protein